MEITTIATPWMWAAFTGVVLTMLALDLGVFHRQAHVVGVREAAIWSVVWVSLALAFNGWLAASFGAQRGLEFLTGYLIEKALAVDNIFVFLVIFASFKVPAAYQHRVLFWGILGALRHARAVHLRRRRAADALPLDHLPVRRLPPAHRHQAPVPARDRAASGAQSRSSACSPGWCRRSPEYHGSRFTVRRDGRTFVTPLLLVLVLIEITDLVFAVDSIPAIFAVTSDPFIVYTSNIFAILGLRAMFFLLAGAMDRFAYLKVGLSFVLMFVGTKMLIVDLYKIPIGLSLAVIAAILGVAVLASWLRERTDAAAIRPG